jgi:hypothetical protein
MRFLPFSGFQNSIKDKAATRVFTAIIIYVVGRMIISKSMHFTITDGMVLCPLFVAGIYFTIAAQPISDNFHKLK